MLAQLKAWGKKALNPQSEKRLREIVFPLVRVAETFVFGSEIRKYILLSMLGLYFASRKRRLLMWYTQGSHFTDFEIPFFDFVFGKIPQTPRNFYRAFFSCECIGPEDRVLDIGCGDAFFTKRFYANIAAQVDAVDIEESAILMAKRRNAANNVNYYLADAVLQPFPKSDGYDVIVWDGALGHSPTDTTQIMMDKICKALHPNGVFIGSESLGSIEGDDHLQFFESLDDLAHCFKNHFNVVQLKESSYPGAGFVRREAYWRCSDSAIRLEKVSWKTY